MKNDPCRNLNNIEFQTEYKGWCISLDGSGLYTVSKGRRFWQWQGVDDTDSALVFIQSIIDAR